MSNVHSVYFPTWTYHDDMLPTPTHPFSSAHLIDLFYPPSGQCFQYLIPTNPTKPHSKHAVKFIPLVVIFIWYLNFILKHLIIRYKQYDTWIVSVTHHLTPSPSILCLIILHYLSVVLLSCGQGPSLLLPHRDICVGPTALNELESPIVGVASMLGAICFVKVVL